jgi:hypothetical protein
MARPKIPLEDPQRLEPFAALQDERVVAAVMETGGAIESHLERRVAIGLRRFGGHGHDIASHTRMVAQMVQGDVEAFGRQRPAGL